MRRLLVGLLLLALFVTGVPKGESFTPQEKHYVTTTFSDGSYHKVVGLDGVPYNNSAKIEVQNNCTIDNAALRISTVYNESGEYPENLKLDIGSDGNVEYAFSGLGYGAFGKQYMFSNGRTYVDLTATGGVHPPVYYIKIPINAHVTNATLKLAPSPTTAVTEVPLSNSNCIDARVDSYTYYRNRNYGSDWYLLSGSRARTHTEYAYIKFDVDDAESNLPSGAVLDRVQIGWYRMYLPYYCYWYQYWGSYRVTESWSESSITWNNRPADSGIREGSQTLRGYSYWGSYTYNRYWDITNMYGYWKDHPSENYGVVLKRYSPTYVWSYSYSNPRAYSSEYYSSTYRPRVRFFYSVMPQGPYVDVGADNDVEWKYNGTMTDLTNVTNLTSAINAYLKSHFYDEVDEYGNKFAYVPISVDAENPGCILRVQGIDIRYNYTHDILYNPYKGNLLNSLREIIPTEEAGTTDVEINITSTNRQGFVNLTDLYLEGYLPNYRPELVENIPDREVNEGEDYPHMYNLTHYFTDDLTDPLMLTYMVVSYTNSTYVALDIVDNYFLSFVTKDDDWYGTVTARVLALDSGGKSVISNAFTITVNSVNDPPRVESPVPDIVIPEEGSYSFYIMKDGSPYFYDVEGDRIYVNYTVDPDPLGLGLSMSEDYEKYVIDLSPETNFNTMDTGPITVTLNVADRPDFSSFIQVTFTITVTSVDDPPEITNIPDVLMEEDSGIPGRVDISNFVRDPDTPFDQLNISFECDNPALSFDYSNGILTIYSEPNYNGISTVTVVVKDTANTVTQTFHVRVASVNDIPEVFVDNLEDGQIIEGLYLIEGKAFDVDGYIRDVEVKVGTSEWEVASGTFLWNFLLDIRVYPLGETTIKVRAYDGIAYSEEKVFNVILRNPYEVVEENYPPVVNITSSLSGTLSGVVTITGTATDDSGYVEKVEVKVDDGVWRPAVGTKSWTYDLNTREYLSGRHTLYIRAFDGRIFSEPLQIDIQIYNEDSDGDGIPDADEIRLRLDPFNPNDATFDYDGDGYTNYEEYLANTDIRDGNIHPIEEKKKEKEPITLWTMIFSALAMVIMVLIAYSLILSVERRRVRWVEGIEGLRVKTRGPTFLQKMVKMKEAILPALVSAPAEAGPALPGAEEGVDRSALPPAEGEVPSEPPADQPAA